MRNESAARDDEHAVSAQAQDFLSDNAAARIPVPLNRWTAPVVRRLVARRFAPSRELAMRTFDVEVAEGAAGGVGIVETRPGGAPTAEPSGDYIVYVHGGAFVFGDALDAVVPQLCAATGMEVLSIDYGLAPEVTFPTPVLQCRAAWDVLTSGRPGRPHLVGLSAGGSLALGLLQTLLRDGRDLPASVVLMTPVVDFENGGGLRDANEGLDPVLRWDGQMDKAIAAYLADADRRDPLANPLTADWSGLDVPVMITTGTRDLLRSDASRLRDRLETAGVRVTMDDAPGMWHAYQGRPELPEARQSTARIAQFISAIR